MSSAGSRGPLLAVLGLGILAISVSSILVRAAQLEGVHSLAIAAWRVAMAGFVLGALSGARTVRANTHHSGRLSTAGWAWTVVAGGFLAAHFATWIVAMESTSIALCTVLLATNPAWVAILAAIVFKEVPSPGTWVGIGVSLGAISLQYVILPEESTSSAGVGIWLALLSAISFGGYLLIGRHLRARMPLGQYFGCVTAVAAFFLMSICGLGRIPLSGYSTIAWVSLGALALVSHVLGHGALNWAARRMPAVTVAMATLGEPLCAAVLAWWVFGERVTTVEWMVMFIVLAGIALVLRGEHKGVTH